MTLSPNGQEMIEGFESRRLTAYQDQRGIWTIGFGSTRNVVAGMTITPEQAAERFLEDVGWAEDAVRRLVKVPLNQNQYDALVSLVFNIGVEAFEHSTLLSLLNQGAYAGASAQFLQWSHTNGATNTGLLKRRQIERDLFEKAV